MEILNEGGEGGKRGLNRGLQECWSPPTQPQHRVWKQKQKKENKSGCLFILIIK